MMTNESWQCAHILKHLEDYSSAFDAELMLCTLTPDQHERLETVISKLIAVAVKRKPKVTS